MYSHAYQEFEKYSSFLKNYEKGNIFDIELVVKNYHLYYSKCNEIISLRMWNLKISLCAQVKCDLIRKLVHLLCALSDFLLTFLFFYHE